MTLPATGDYTRACVNDGNYSEFSTNYKTYYRCAGLFAEYLLEQRTGSEKKVEPIPYSNATSAAHVRQGVFEKWRSTLTPPIVIIQYSHVYRYTKEEAGMAVSGECWRGSKSGLENKKRKYRRKKPKTAIPVHTRSASEKNSRRAHVVLYHHTCYIMYLYCIINARTRLRRNRFT